MTSQDILKSSRQRLDEGNASLADVFRIGQRVEEAARDLAAQGNQDGDTRIERIAVLGGVNIDYLAWAAACAAVQEGVAPVLYRCPFGAYVQEVIDPSSSLHKFRPTVVLMAIDWRDVVGALPPSARPEEVAAHINAKVQMLEHLWAVLKDKLQCRIIQHILVAPDWGGRGVAERFNPASAVSQVRTINDRLLHAGAGRVHWVEMDRLAHSVGLRNWASERLYHSTKSPFDPRYLPDYLPYLRAAWRLAFATPKKVLALDLDNTLWGGVIGDDGVQGIKLGQGSVAGEAFAAWGGYIAELRTRGVILAVCSKNSENIASEGFSHPFSRLKKDDFAALECSWDDKATGLRRLAKKLNVGLDSFVFADDNPVECALVASELPQVAVVPMGDDPTRFIDILERGRWFDLDSYTSEDFGRAAAYSALRQAADERNSAPDMSTFLRDLRMVGSVYHAGAADLDRLAQLEHKTNQFNLTTRRYTASDLEKFMQSKDGIVLALRLSDRFAAHGLVSTLIAFHEGDTLRIDSWLMSCRVFSRTAEHFMIQVLADLARERKTARIVGEYLPTAKNEVVSDLYSRLGFTDRDGDGRFWSRDLNAEAFCELDCFIKPDPEIPLASAISAVVQRTAERTDVEI